KPGILAEPYRGGIAAMLTADAELQVVAGAPAAFCRDLDQFSNTIEIERDAGIMLDNPLALVGGNEGGGIIARHAEGGLREVVGAEREEVRSFGNDMGTNG